MRRDDVGRYDRSRFGMTEADLEKLLSLLAEVGFGPVEVERREIQMEHMAAMLTHRRPKEES